MQTDRTRLTRAERKTQTREALLDAAARVFARRGFHGASVDQVAEEAGFTKGAVYSNFASKEQLFLALFDRHVDARMRALSEIAASDRPVEEQLLAGARDFMGSVSADRDMSLLLVEFWTYALRDEGLREEVARRVRRVRTEMGRLFTRQAEALGVELPLAPEDLALAMLAGANGMALEKMIDPAHVSDDVFGQALVFLFRGMVQS